MVKLSKRAFHESLPRQHDRRKERPKIDAKHNKVPPPTFWFNGMNGRTAPSDEVWLTPLTQIWNKLFEVTPKVLFIANKGRTFGSIWSGRCKKVLHHLFNKKFYRHNTPREYYEDSLACLVIWEKTTKRSFTNYFTKILRFFLLHNWNYAK